MIYLYADDWQDNITPSYNEADQYWDIILDSYINGSRTDLQTCATFAEFNGNERSYSSHKSLMLHFDHVADTLKFNELSHPSCRYYDR